MLRRESLRNPTALSTAVDDLLNIILHDFKFRKLKKSSVHHHCTWWPVSKVARSPRIRERISLRSQSRDQSPILTSVLATSVNQRITRLSNVLPSSQLSSDKQLFAITLCVYVVSDQDMRSKIVLSRTKYVVFSVRKIITLRCVGRVRRQIGKL